MLICLKDKNTLEIIKIKGSLNYEEQELRLIHRCRYSKDGYRLLKKKRTSKKRHFKLYKIGYNNDDELQDDSEWSNSIEYEEGNTSEDYNHQSNQNADDNESNYW